MRSGIHIPTYLMCERFIEGKTVLDLHPPDDIGTAHLAKSAKHISVVYPSMQQCHSWAEKEVTPMGASFFELPFANGSFDLVISSNPDFSVSDFSLDRVFDLFKRILLPTGLGAVLVPNRETLAADYPGAAAVPDFIGLERTIRRYFPHILILAQQPLFGATLTPIGRRPKDDAPLLDDRMLPDGGELPEYFLALCSSRYHKLDDTTIAQLPFAPLRDSFRLQTEKYEGTIQLIQREKQTRDHQIDQLRQQLAEYREKLTAAEDACQDRASLATQVGWLQEQLNQKSAHLDRMEQAREEIVSRSLALEGELDQHKRSQRLLTQQNADLHRRMAQLQTEREDAVQEQSTVREHIRTARQELMTKQREFDTCIADLAAREAEIERLGKELRSTRQALNTALEQTHVLKQSSREATNLERVITSMEEELTRERERFASEKQQLNQQIDARHQQLLDEIAAREATKQQVQELEVQLKQQEWLLSTDQTKTDDQKREMAALNETLTKQQAELRRLVIETRRQASLLAEKEQVIIDQNAHLERKDLSLKVLSTRADESDQRSKVLETRLVEFQHALAEEERKNKALQMGENRFDTLQANHDALLKTNGELRQQLARIEEDRIEAKHESEAHSMWESKYVVVAEQNTRLKEELQRQESQYVELELKALRLGQLEKRHKAAFAQIEQLHREMDTLRDRANTSASLANRAQTAENRLARLETDYRQSQTALEQTTAKIKQMEQDLEAAMQALAMTEEGAEKTIHTAADRIRLLKNEIQRLKQENDTELLCVKEDLESELKVTGEQLDSAQQEIWELREEVVRLQAQSAASAAAASEKGINENLQKTLIDQEQHINELLTERSGLRNETRHLRHSLEKKKKNMRILATILHREHQENKGTGPSGNTPENRLLSNTDADAILAHIETDDAHPPTERDDEIVEAIMNSVLATDEDDVIDNETSFHLQLENDD